MATPTPQENYGTSPPSETSRDLADFQSRHGEAPRFAGKGQGNCTWSMPDGTIRRSFRRTAAGKLAGGWKGGSYAPQKLGPPCVLLVGSSHEDLPHHKIVPRGVVGLIVR